MDRTAESTQITREFRGAWIATVDNIDWPSKPGLPIETQKVQLLTTLKILSKSKFNAVLFQVRPSCDSLYVSDLEPSSWFLTKQQGEKLTFDPLQYAVEQGHKLGLEVHAWFNPFRAGHPAQKGNYCSTHVTQSHPDWIKTYGRYKWLDPGLPAAREFSKQAVLDVVRRYDIDGVHIDDYFYPYPEDGQVFDDETSYLTYRNSGSESKLDWRRRNVNELICDLNSEIKEIKPWVKFGISPFGIYRPNVPTGIKAGVDQYNDLAADVKLWLESGWCDYVSPQLYWKISSEGQPFDKLLKWWLSINTKKRHIWPGLYTSLLNKSLEPTEIINQIKIVRNRTESKGHVHFSSITIQNNVKNFRNILDAQLYDNYAISPEYTWLESPKKRNLQVSIVNSRLVWQPGDDDRFYIVSAQKNGLFHVERIGNECNVDLKALPTTTSHIRVDVLSKTGKITDSVTVKI